MPRKYFGTDGVRGQVGEAPITPDFIMRLGYAAGRVLAGHRASAEHPTVLIGKDTRISGYMLESALQAGLSAAGVDTLLTGPIPTPGIAYLTRTLRLSAGIVISASHNPYPDNGIKFFSAHGTKLADDVERAIEAAIDEPLGCVPSNQLGRARRLPDAAGRYIEFCKSTFPFDRDLKGLKLVVDCAHGAAYHIAPHVFHELGADVIAIGDAPDGLNINAGVGATAPALLAETVVAEHADLGIALDGDGDRLMLVDGAGRIYDGDAALYVIAMHRRREGALLPGVVGTLMTNLGLERAFAANDIAFARAAVGDRYVLEMLQNQGWTLGGENSGHILCLDKHTTGDGIVSALQVLHAVQQSGTNLAELTRPLVWARQKLINVRVPKGLDARQVPEVQRAVAAAEAALGQAGRVLLRPSGTEPVVRVMVEAEDPNLAEFWAEEIATTVRALVG